VKMTNKVLSSTMLLTEISSGKAMTNLFVEMRSLYSKYCTTINEGPYPKRMIFSCSFIILMKSSTSFGLKSSMKCLSLSNSFDDSLMDSSRPYVKSMYCLKFLNPSFFESLEIFEMEQLLIKAASRIFKSEWSLA